MYSMISTFEHPPVFLSLNNLKSAKRRESWAAKQLEDFRVVFLPLGKVLKASFPQATYTAPTLWGYDTLNSREVFH